MPQYSIRALNSFPVCLAAECGARWRQATLIATIACAAAGLVIVTTRDALTVYGDSVSAVASTAIGAVGCALIGALSLVHERRWIGSWLVAAPGAVRRRVFFAKVLFTLMAAALIAAAAAAPWLLCAPDAFCRYPYIASVLGTLSERPAALVAFGAAALASAMAGLCWSFCAHGSRWSLLPGLVTAASLWLIAWEFLPWLVVSLWATVVPVEVVVACALAAIGSVAWSYRVAAAHPPGKAVKRRWLVPVGVVLLSGMVGIAVRAGAAAVYVNAPLRGSPMQCLPSPDGRSVAILNGESVVHPHLVWRVVRADNGVARPTQGFGVARPLAAYSWRKHTADWSPDGRYFAHPATSRWAVFLQLLLPRHPSLGLLSSATVNVFDTADQVCRSVAWPGDVSSLRGWPRPGVLRFTEIGATGDMGRLTVHDVNVETDRPTSRDFHVETDLTVDWVMISVHGAAVVRWEWQSDDLPRGVAVLHLVDFDSGRVVTKALDLVVEAASVDIVGPRRVAFWGPPSYTSPEVFESCVIDILSGRKTLISKSSKQSPGEAWQPALGQSRAARWLHVVRGDEEASGLFDLQAGTLIRRTDWPTMHDIRRWYWLTPPVVLPSPGEKRWLLLDYVDLPGGSSSVWTWGGYPDPALIRFTNTHVWTLDLDAPQGPFVKHVLADPADPRAAGPENAHCIAWVNDREIVFLTDRRQLVFYDVVDKKRTRVVTVK